jgi:ACS family glucarate transporter-like MFS transporter
VKRFAVVFALFLMSVIFYIDRAAISSTLGPMSAELGFSLKDKGLIFGAFALGYALAQIPGGMLADRLGPRWILVGCVVGWSVFTGLTGAVGGLLSLVVVRFLFGVAEAGALPAAARVFYNWLPVRERGRANGIAFSGTRLGAALSFPLFAWMIPTLGWRAAFAVFAGIGLVWAAGWALWFRDHPDPPIVQEPVASGPAMSLGQALRSRGMICNMFQYFAGNFTFFLSISWMLTYLQNRYRLTPQEAAGYSMVPLLFATGSMWASGFAIDGLFRSRLRAWSLRLPGMAGFLLAIGGLLALMRAETAAGAVACLTITMFGADLTIAPSWQFCVDIGAKNSAAVSGAMNMVGNIGAFLSPIAFSRLYVEATHDASNYFIVAAALNVLAVLCWLDMRSRSAPAPVSHSTPADPPG